MTYGPGLLPRAFFRQEGDYMTLLEAINQVDSVKFNTYSQEDKVRWISSLDRKISVVLDGPYQGAMGIFAPYDIGRDMDTELLLDSPWDEMYLRWMEAMIDYNNGETDSYNRSITLFNNLYENFMAWYIRSNMPRQNGGFVF